MARVEALVRAASARIGRRAVACAMTRWRRRLAHLRFGVLVGFDVYLSMCRCIVFLPVGATMCAPACGYGPNRFVSSYCHIHICTHKHTYSLTHSRSHTQVCNRAKRRRGRRWAGWMWTMWRVQVRRTMILGRTAATVSPSSLHLPLLRTLSEYTNMCLHTCVHTHTLSRALSLCFPLVHTYTHADPWAYVFRYPDGGGG